MAKSANPSRQSNAPKRKTLIRKRFEAPSAESAQIILDGRFKKYAETIVKSLSTYVGNNVGKAPEDTHFREYFVSAMNAYTCAVEGFSREEKEYFNKKLCEEYRQANGYSLPRETLDALVAGKDVSEESISATKSALANLKPSGKTARKEDTAKFIRDIAAEQNASPEKVIKDAEKEISDFFNQP